ncbi:MAG: hypothetical protein WCK34_02095 [Bacteroidota bacterium]
METTENKNTRGNFCGRPGHRIGWIILGIVGFTAFAFLFGAVVMWLWNWLMPSIFHLGVITYCQAIGLAILSRLLFGSLHHGGSHHRGFRKPGPWKHMHHNQEGKSCRDYSYGGKWNHYDQYWNEEGENAFNEYLKRKGESAVRE